MKKAIRRVGALSDYVPSSDTPIDRIAQDDQVRSEFMRQLIMKADRRPRTSEGSPVVPQVLMQFWDDGTTMPADVRDCIDSWRPLQERGITRLLFDDAAAAAFIDANLGSPYSIAFRRCSHPAMRSDYFRLCFIALNGGFYVDADEFYLGGDCVDLFRDNRLWLQPLCYDNSTAEMVSPDIFWDMERTSPEWTYYANNNPLIAPASHPVILIALARSTRKLLMNTKDRPDIQSITGPGNLTGSLVHHAIALETAGVGRDFAFLDWDGIAVSRWPLGYRGDARNWRIWLQHR